MTTETHAGRIRKEFNSTGDVWPSDIEWLIEQAERAKELDFENQKFSKRFDRQAKENSHIQELVKILKLHATHCDADGRAIQPFEVIDVINEFTAGETNGQRKA